MKYIKQKNILKNICQIFILLYYIYIIYIPEYKNYFKNYIYYFLFVKLVKRYFSITSKKL